MRILLTALALLLVPLVLHASVRCEDVFAAPGTLSLTAAQVRYIDELVHFQIDKDRLSDKDEVWAQQEFHEKYKAALEEFGPGFREYYLGRLSVVERELAKTDEVPIDVAIKIQRKRLVQPFDAIEHDKLSEWGPGIDETHRLALDQRALRIYDLAAQKMTPFPNAHLIDPLSLDNPLLLSADRQTLFTTHGDQVVRLEARGGVHKQKLSHKTRWGFSEMTLTPDQKNLVLTGSQSEIYILDARTLKEIDFFDLSGPLFLFKGDRHLAISKDNRYLFFITGRGARFVYDLQKRERRDLENLNKFPGDIQDAVFTARPGRVILRCDVDQIAEYDFLMDQWVTQPSKANESSLLVGSADERYVVWGRRARDPDLNQPVLRLFDTQTQNLLPLPEGLETIREIYRIENDGDQIFIAERRDVAGAIHNFMWIWNLSSMKVSSYEVPASVDLASARHMKSQGPAGIVFKTGQRGAIELRAPAD